ncbi:hypothetical protein CYMTET_55040 [Cymbomonas tetramitiformis]|uniref:[histone H3]-lysine(4) N-trimethyltransferase n=1 Tax=Cymbomonas tetramitiformis TaxID=36881 RepID=A0AAE0BFJ0_9CHLO|nr:hypothetical protein CYMTET_55040 [Cymbomonas tetramitiformis]
MSARMRHLLTGSEDATKAVFTTELKAHCKLLGQGKDIDEVGILRLAHATRENASAFDVLKEVMWGGGYDEVVRCKGWASALRNIGADPRAWTSGSYTIHTYYKKHLLEFEMEIIKSATGSGRPRSASRSPSWDVHEAVKVSARPSQDRAPFDSAALDDELLGLYASDPEPADSLGGEATAEGSAAGADAPDGGRHSADGGLREPLGLSIDLQTQPLPSTSSASQKRPRGAGSRRSSISTAPDKARAKRSKQLSPTERAPEPLLEDSAEDLVTRALHSHTDSEPPAADLHRAESLSVYDQFMCDGVPGDEDGCDHPLIGHQARRYFADDAYDPTGHGSVIDGEISAFYPAAQDSEEDVWLVEYENGQKEHLDLAEVNTAVQAFLMDMRDPQQLAYAQAVTMSPSHATQGQAAEATPAASGDGPDIMHSHTLAAWHASGSQGGTSPGAANCTVTQPDNPRKGWSRTETSIHGEDPAASQVTYCAPSGHLMHSPEDVAKVFQKMPLQCADLQLSDFNFLPTDPPSVKGSVAQSLLQGRSSTAQPDIYPETSVTPEREVETCLHQSPSSRGPAGDGEVPLCRAEDARQPLAAGDGEGPPHASTDTRDPCTSLHRRKYHGVRLVHGKWAAVLKIPPKTKIYLGSFLTPEAAAWAYDQEAAHIDGLSLNFPEERACHMQTPTLHPHGGLWHQPHVEGSVSETPTVAPSARRSTSEQSPSLQAHPSPGTLRKFRGVWHKGPGSYVAGIYIRGSSNRRVQKVIGKFSTAEEAARAYDQEAVKHTGKVLNFPEEHALAETAPPRCRSMPTPMKRLEQGGHEACESEGVHQGATALPPSSSSVLENDVEDDEPNMAASASSCARSRVFRAEHKARSRTWLQQAQAAARGAEVLAGSKPNGRLDSARQRHREIPQMLFNEYTRTRGLEKKIFRVEKSSIQGLGVMILEPMRKGEMLMEYVGEYVRSTVADLRERRYSVHENTRNTCFLFMVDPATGLILDATCRGSLARYVNHSCSPNCETRVIRVQGLKKVMITARYNLLPGEELTYDYGFVPELPQDQIPCKCGSDNCRGYLNG